MDHKRKEKVYKNTQSSTIKCQIHHPEWLAKLEISKTTIPTLYHKNTVHIVQLTQNMTPTAVTRIKR